MLLTRGRHGPSGRGGPGSCGAGSCGGGRSGSGSGGAAVRDVLTVPGTGVVHACAGWNGSTH